VIGGLRTALVQVRILPGHTRRIAPPAS